MSTSQEFVRGIARVPTEPTIEDTQEFGPSCWGEFTGGESGTLPVPAR